VDPRDAINFATVSMRGPDLLSSANLSDQAPMAKRRVWAQQPATSGYVSTSTGGELNCSRAASSQREKTRLRHVKASMSCTRQQQQRLQQSFDKQ
jgi:hypothetical protein